MSSNTIYNIIGEIIYKYKDLIRAIVLNIRIN
jgi:hypothetical protein